jgi:hypothetical protein
MADYFTSTVVQPDIPLADMTPLERLVLGAIFDIEESGGVVYFFARDGINDCPSLPIAALRDAWVQADGTPSRLHDLVTEQLAETAADAEALELDLSVEGYECILQDIVRRSETLTHVSVVAAFTCSKMRADGFGGMATLITAKEIIGESTHGLLEKWLADAFP